MRVFENVNAVVEKYGTLIGPEFAKNYVISELNRVLQELIPIRGDKEATNKYFHKNLCHDYNVHRFEEINAEQVLNGVEVSETEYKPGPSECLISENIIHPILRDIIEPDRYSFGHLYWLLCSEYNRSVGYAFYNDIVVTDAVVNYAIKFDPEELKNIKFDIIDTLDQIDILLLESKDFEFGSQDPVLCKLKARFESYANDYKSILEKKLSRITVDKHPKQGTQVKEIPLYSNSIGFEEDPPEYYLCYFDFTECPIDLSKYPFQIHLGNYKIVRTQRGLEDANPIFLDIFSNEIRLICETYTDDGQQLFESTRELLRSLFTTFMCQCEKAHHNDYKQLTTFAKWWALNANRCIDTVFYFKFPSDDYDPSIPDSTPNFMKSEWKDCVIFIKTMKEYCLYLTISYLKQMQCHPFKQMFSIVPFNYYKDDFQTVEAKAKSKKVRDENDRIILDFMSNCKHLRTFLIQQLSRLDGMDIQDNNAVSTRQSIISEIIGMLNHYICRVDAIGITDYDSQSYCFNMWKWLVREMMDIIIMQPIIEYPASMKGEADVYLRKYYLKSAIQYDSFRTIFNKNMVAAEKDYMNELYENAKSEKEHPAGNTDGSPNSYEHNLKSFSERVTKSVNAKVLFDYLTEKITTPRIKGVDAFVYIDAVVRLKYIHNFTFRLATTCFGDIGSESNYNKYVGKDVTFKVSIEQIMDEIKDVLAKANDQ